MAAEREAWRPREYAVFRRMDGNVVPGMDARAIASAVMALLLGVTLFFALGAVTRPARVELGYEERAAAEKEYSDMQSALEYEERLAVTPEEDWEYELGALRKYTLGGYDDAEISALAQRAREAGMSADTTPAEALAMAPVDMDGEKPVLPTPWRAALALIPAVVVVALKFESRGVCLQREIRQAAEWRKSAKEYWHGGAR